VGSLPRALAVSAPAAVLVLVAAGTGGLASLTLRTLFAIDDGFAEALARLRFVFDAGLVLLVFTASFAAALLAVTPSLHELAELQAAASLAPPSDSLWLMGVLCLLSAFFLVRRAAPHRAAWPRADASAQAVTVCSATFVLGRTPWDDQTFLWLTLSTGVAACALVALATLALYHEAAVALSSGECLLLAALSLAVLALALLGLLRLHCWARAVGPLRASAPVGAACARARARSLTPPRAQHALGLAVAAAALLCAAWLLFQRAGALEDAATRERALSLFGPRVRVGREWRAIVVTARAQLSVLGAAALAAAPLCALLALAARSLRGMLREPEPLALPVRACL
jgi:hypothetical protein